MQYTDSARVVAREQQYLPTSCECNVEQKSVKHVYLDLKKGLRYFGSYGDTSDFGGVWNRTQHFAIDFNVLGPTHGGTMG
jgi:hypothetical protein